LRDFPRRLSTQVADFLTSCEEELASEKYSERGTRVAIWDPNLQC